MSVVIPTIGRLSLIRALESARAQKTSAIIEIIVVYDGEDNTGLDSRIISLADKVVCTTGFTGGGNSRNLGIQSASGEMVAFLDDDDEWSPDKIQRQLELLFSSDNPQKTIVSGRQRYIDVKSGKISNPGPLKLIEPHEPVEHYLFRGRSPHGGRASMYTSTLLCSAELARSVAWNPKLKRHQDWDFLVRAGRQDGVSFLQVKETVAFIYMGSQSSISASSNWEPSMDWALKLFSNDSQTLADFLVAQPLRYALQARDLGGIRSVFRNIVKNRKIPKAGPWIIALAGLLSRSWIEKITAISTPKS